MICVIPARGGSKRLPGKNIKKLFGRPIIEYVIDVCYEADIFEDVIVSTDSDEIANVVSTGHDMRPEHLCGDVSESEVLIDFMERHGVDEICRVYPFAALLDENRLRFGDSVFGYFGNTVMERVRYKHPIQRAVKENGEYYDFESVMRRTQDLPESFHDAATYMFTTLDELKQPLYWRQIQWVNVSELDCQDVDDAEDFEMLKMKIARRLTW